MVWIGTTAAQRPARATAPGMPQTTLDAFVLRDDGAARRDDRAAARKTVRAHAGQHDAQRHRCRSFRGGAEQDVDRRLAEMDGRRVRVREDGRRARGAMILQWCGPAARWTWPGRSGSPCWATLAGRPVARVISAHIGATNARACGARRRPAARRATARASRSRRVIACGPPVDAPSDDHARRERAETAQRRAASERRRSPHRAHGVRRAGHERFRRGRLPRASTA